jgi:DNA-binding transcriptional MerR regulator
MKANSPLRNAVGFPEHPIDAPTGTLVGREMTIGEMARAYGVTLRTLRFYEDRNLLKPRRAGNARFYGGVDRARLAMILKGKQLGFTLTEIAELIGADDGAARSEFEERLQPEQIVDQLDHLERQRREIDDAIVLLKATRERLAEHAHPA